MKFNNLKTMALAAMLIAGSAHLPATTLNDGGLKATLESVVQINPTTIELRLNGNQRITLDFYSDNIFRMFQDNGGGIVRDPKPMDGYPDAQILVDNPRTVLEKLEIKENDKLFTITTARIQLDVCRSPLSRVSLILCVDCRQESAHRGSRP